MDTTITKTRAEIQIFHLNNAYYLLTGKVPYSDIEHIEELIKSEGFDRPEFHILVALKFAIAIYNQEKENAIKA